MLDRAATVDALPSLGVALTDGDVSGAHVDVVGRALRALEPEHREQLAAQAGWLVEHAVASSPDQFERTVRAEVRRLQASDGMARLERQQRAARLRSWIDDDGMWCVFGRFDPETGLRLTGRLAATVDRLFAERRPDHAPSDAAQCQQFLRAHALVALIDGDAPDPSRTEFVVVVDTTGVSEPIVDWGLPVELPLQVLHDLFEVADVHPVIVRNGVVLHAPGRLDLGRTTRIANRAQRRALRALYPSCGIPGCEVRYDWCKLHHVEWWERSGRSDLANLLPLCTRHHRAVHTHGWRLTLAADRTLTVEYPDGTRQTTGPPQRHAA